MKHHRLLIACTLGCLTVAAQSLAASLDLAVDDPPSTPGQSSSSSLLLPPPKSSVWHQDIGQGFNQGAMELGISAGASLGLARFFGHNNHNLALATVDFGWILSDPVFDGHWFCGNWELVSEALAGGQFHPKSAYVAGAAEMLRYDFATGTRWLPFIGGGFGPAAQNIGLPDLSTTFEFNVQGGVGMSYFLNENSALTFETRFFHLSNAGLHEPNESVNTALFLLGWHWCF